MGWKKYTLGNSKRAISPLKTRQDCLSFYHKDSLIFVLEDQANKIRKLKYKNIIIRRKIIIYRWCNCYLQHPRINDGPSRTVWKNQVGSLQNKLIQLKILYIPN